MVNDENQRVAGKTPSRGRPSERFPFSPMNKTSSFLKTIRDNQMDETNKMSSPATKRSTLASPPPSKTADSPAMLSPPSKNLLSPMWDFFFFFSPVAAPGPHPPFLSNSIPSHPTPSLHFQSLPIQSHQEKSFTPTIAPPSNRASIHMRSTTILITVVCESLLCPSTL